MSFGIQSQAIIPSELRVAAGQDRFGEQRGLGISVLAFKVSGQDSSDLFVIEQTLGEKGGPARHLHYDQDEWFYALKIESEMWTILPSTNVLQMWQIGKGYAIEVSTPAKPPPGAWSIRPAGFAR